MLSRTWPEGAAAALGRRIRLAAAALALAGTALAVTLATPALAWVELFDPLDSWREDPHGVHITDGSYVMNVGELHINITNHGLIGSQFSIQSTLSDAPSAQWPAGSGVEYLWSAGLWVGGIQLGSPLVSTGQYDMEFRPGDDARDTIYEGISGILTRPPGNADASGRRAPQAANDDDDDGLIDEEILNGYDDDDDGLIDEDFGQAGNQMMVCTMYDNTRIARELYADHVPLNLEVIMQTYAWENDDVDDFVGFEFFITNIGVAAIEDVYIGFFADCDIGPRSVADAASDDVAGSWEGMVLAKDKSYVPVSVGYMFDDDGDSGQTPGYIGLLFLGHDTDPTGETAPLRVEVRSYQAFAGQVSFEQGGDPVNDSDRYELLSREERDNNTFVAKKNDFRILVANGPFQTLSPGDTLQFQAAIVVGPGLQGLQTNAAEAALTFYGNYFNTDGDIATGQNGRETRICQEDFALNASGQNPIFTFAADFMDTSCVDVELAQAWPRIVADDLSVVENIDDPDFGKHCVYVNMDNCFECSRQNGIICDNDKPQLQETWNCWEPLTSDSEKGGCTGIGGMEHNIRWLVGMAPPPPGLRVWPLDNTVHVFWDDRSEVTKDIRTAVIDFESYRIWRADNWTRPFGSSVVNGPESTLWQLIAEYDVVNTFITTRELVDHTVVSETLPLGANTGLTSIQYMPVCLADTSFGERFDGLPEAMQEVVDGDVENAWSTRPPLRDRDGIPVPALEGLLPWEGYPAELDTFFMAAARAESVGVVAKHGTRFYEYVDHDVHNGFLYFYSVTATDHSVRLVGDDYVTIGEGQSGDPGSSFTHTVPAAAAQSAEERALEGANIYVYPNPATRDALEEFQEFLPNADDPTGVHVCFANLPAARNTIKIFTEDGDLVQTVYHDGTSGYGQASWNLVSRNGQEIVSGIYLYAVQSQDDRFEDFIGKFVVVR